MWCYFLIQEQSAHGYCFDLAANEECNGEIHEFRAEYTTSYEIEYTTDYEIDYTPGYETEYMSEYDSDYTPEEIYKEPITEDKFSSLTTAAREKYAQDNAQVNNYEIAHKTTSNYVKHEITPEKQKSNIETLSLGSAASAKEVIIILSSDDDERDATHAKKTY
jgi:hypothetical protein